MFFCGKVADTRKGLLVSNQNSSPNPDNSFWTMKVSVLNEFPQVFSQEGGHRPSPDHQGLLQSRDGRAWSAKKCKARQQDRPIDLGKASIRAKRFCASPVAKYPLSGSLVGSPHYNIWAMPADDGFILTPYLQLCDQSQQSAITLTSDLQ